MATTTYWGWSQARDETHVSYGSDSDGVAIDGYDYFLGRGSFAQDVERSGSRLLPTWDLFLNHPTYDSVWSSRAVEDALNRVAVPTLTVGGYYDQEDMYGPQEEYARLEPHDLEHDNFLVLGPWRHGYWSSSSRHLGNLDYGEPIGTEFRTGIEAKFFAHYLKDEPGFDLADTASFQTGSEHMEVLRALSASRVAPHKSLSRRRRSRSVGSASTAPSTTSYVSNPARSRSLQAPAHPADL